MMGQHPSDRALVIIPTYNEIENLPLIVARVHKARPDVHVLVVDDGQDLLHGLSHFGGVATGQLIADG